MIQGMIHSNTMMHGTLRNSLSLYGTIKPETVPKSRKISGLPPLTYTAKEEGTLKNYRIYGQTVDGESVGDRTNNILPMSTTPIDTIIDDFHCEYDGMGTIKLTALTDNAVLSGFTVPLSKEFTIPLSVEKGGTGCWQMNNDAAYMNVNNSPSFTLELWDNTDIRDYWNLSTINRVNFNYGSMGGTNINSISIRTVADVATNIQSGQTLTISPAFVENVTVQVPFEPYGYKVPVTVSDGTDTLTTNLYLPEQIRKVGDEAEYIDYGEQKQHRVRKNLLQNMATSQAISGVEVTVNSDKSISLSFDSVPFTRWVTINSNVSVKDGYILNGCPNLGINGLSLRATSTNTQNYVSDAGTGVLINDTIGEYANILIRVPSGYANSSLTFYPMIRKSDIEDDTYEPYIENTEVDVTLPALPTLPGTNVLSVGTEVQPSEVEVTGRIRPVPTGGGE